MLAGSYGGDEVSLSKMFEAVGAYKAGMIDDAQLEDCTDVYKRQVNMWWRANMP